MEITSKKKKTVDQRVNIAVTLSFDEAVSSKTINVVE